MQNKDNQAEYQRERDRYMGKEITHAEFYLWLADWVGIGESLIPASAAEVERSTDPHLNDIQLGRWDNMDSACRAKASQKGIAWSLCDTVCCLKSLARRRQANAKATA